MVVFELVLGEGTGQRKTSEFLFFLVLQDSFFIFTACVVFIIFIALTVAVTIFCLFCVPHHAIHGVFLQPCCGVFLRIWKSLEHISSQSFFHSWLVCWTKLQLLLGGDYHGALVDEGFCGLVLYIMRRVSPPPASRPSNCQYPGCSHWLHQ